MPVRLPAGLRLVYLDDAGAFPAIAIDTPACRALVALQGAQLLRMVNAAGAELCWLSPGARFVPGRAVRGGIPLCFPWFGAHPMGPGKQAHGFARIRGWRLDGAAMIDGVVRLAFLLEDDESSRMLWPHAFRAVLIMDLGADVRLELSVTNPGETPLPLEFAFHSYFPVTDIAACHVEGLEGVAFSDKLHPNSPLMSEKEFLRFTGETDRVYQGAGGRCCLVDRLGGHTLAIDAPSCGSVVVWNPWDAKASRLGDVPGDSWRRMVCIESGNVGVHAPLLAVGETKAWELRVSCVKNVGGQPADCPREPDA